MSKKKAGKVSKTKATKGKATKANATKAKATKAAKVTKKKVAKKPAGKKKVTKVAKVAKIAKSAGKSAKVTKSAKTTKAAKVTKETKTTKSTTKKKTVSAASRALSSGPKSASGRPSHGTLSSAKVESLIPDEPLTEAQLRKAKSGLSKKELADYRQALLEKRADLLGDVESLDKSRNNSGGDLSHMPLHMADVGSDNYEQEFTLGLVESERRMLNEINDALERMLKNYYGVCIESGRPIGKARLDIQPWAKYCIEVVRERERNGRY